MYYLWSGGGEGVDFVSVTFKKNLYMNLFVLEWAYLDWVYWSLNRPNIQIQHFAIGIVIKRWKNIIWRSLSIEWHAQAVCNQWFVGVSIFFVYAKSVLHIPSFLNMYLLSIRLFSYSENS